VIASLNPLSTAREFVGRASDVARHDAEILERCRALAPWGLVAAIDLQGCHPRSIRDAGQIECLAITLCDLIQARSLGDPIVVRFGDEARVGGYSLCQRIETGLISGHFDEQSNRAYIDVFSRRLYRPYQAAEFCFRWLGAQSMRVNVVVRSPAAAPMLALPTAPGSLSDTAQPRTCAPARVASRAV